MRAAIGPLLLLAAVSAAQAYGTARGETNLRLPLFLLAVLLQVVVLGAVFRGRIGRARPGPLGFQWGAPEWRLLGVNVALYAVCAIIAVILFALLVMAVVVIAGGAGLDPATSSVEDVGAALGPVGAVLLIGAAIGMFVLVACLVARLLPAFAATAATDRLVFWGSWFFTRGAGWSLLGAMVLVYLPTLGVSLAGGLASGLAPNAGATGGTAALLAMLAGAAALVQLPLMAGLSMAAYERLAPDVQTGSAST